MLGFALLTLSIGAVAAAAEMTPSTTPKKSTTLSAIPTPIDTTQEVPGTSTSPSTTPEESRGTGDTSTTSPSPDSSPDPTPTPDPGIKCGDNVWGKLENGVLTINGTGNMWDYSETNAKTAPFYNVKDQIFKIVINDGVTQIGGYMFAWSACQEVQIGRGVKDIHLRAFYCCRNLRSVTIPGNVDRIWKGAFRGCTALTHCELSQGIEIIGINAFNNTPLTSVALPDGLQCIYEGAFNGTQLTGIVIPATVTRIEKYAFGLKPINATIYSSNISIEAPAFAAGSTLAVLRNSKAEAYAKKYGLNISYLECTPVGGVPVAEHTMGNAVIVEEATCVSAGKRQYTCTRCGYVKTEKIPITNHSFGNWQMLSEPTVLDAGVQGRTCAVCGYTEKQEVAKLQATIQLNTNRISLKAGETFKLRVIAKAKGDSVALWKSSDKSIAKVGAAGKVTAKAPGTVTVTATMESGISASVTVVVKRTPTKKLSVSVSGATMRSKKITVKARKSFTLVPKVTPSNSTDKVTYKSSKQSVVAVSAKGRVTALRKGKAKITVKSGKKKVVITVTVS